MGKKLKTKNRSVSEAEDYIYDPKDFEDKGDIVPNEFLQEGEYNIEQVMDMKIENGKKLYLIKWDGFPHSQNTWEPVEHLTKVLYMVEQFEDEYAKKKSMQEEDFSYLIQEDHPKEEVIFKKKKLKKLDEPVDGEEFIIKKRKLDSTENGSNSYEKRIVSKEDADEEGLNEGMMEISYDKSELDKPQKKEKKKLTKPFLPKASSVKDQDLTTMEELEDRLFKGNDEDIFRFLEKDTREVDKFGGIEDEEIISEKKVKNKEETKEPTIEIKSQKPQARSLKAILAKKQSSNITSHTSSKISSKKKDKTGGFRNKDKPKTIVSIKPGKDSGLLFLVEWQRRGDGVQPASSYVTSEDMKMHDPYFLIDFYESKLVRINKHKKSKQAKAASKTMEIERFNDNVPGKDNPNPIESQIIPIQDQPQLATTPTPDKNINKEQSPKIKDPNTSRMLEELDQHMSQPDQDFLHFDGSEEAMLTSLIQSDDKETKEGEGYISIEKATESSEHGNDNRGLTNEKGNKDKESQGDLVSVGS